MKSQRTFRLILRKTFIAALGVLIFFGPIVFFTLWNPFKAKAAWYDDSWSYRQSITITNNGSTQSNYQVAVYVDTQSLIAAGKLQSDCDDLRFTDTHAVVLSYVLEYCSNTSGRKSIVWVTGNFSNGSSTIYMYYGNSSAASVSSPGAIPTGIDYGDGNDGTITISANKNINTDAIESGHSCADGGDGVVYQTTSSTSGSTITLSTTPSSGCLSAGDEVLIINLQGTTADNSNVGQYEFARISSISTNT